ncbi:MAG: methylated-DNA--[protein]-cysteine S-methyltransferase [Methylophaga sp.]|nr:methylated-DNA--[protein]-cysteine S-methyltransferase [Methylophaga sp.]
MEFQKSFQAPFGPMMLYTDEKVVQGIDLFPAPSNIISDSSDILCQLEQQLNDYFFDENTKWALPLARKGTDFQQRVWRYMRAIPVGETRSYGEVAKALNSSAQAVGNACRANHFPIVIPCHRIVSKSGLGGFAGETSGNRINVKQWLLDHER